jgi:hypothetical protein
VYEAAYAKSGDLNLLFGAMKGLSCNPGEDNRGRAALGGSLTPSTSASKFLHDSLLQGRRRQGELFDGAPASRISFWFRNPFYGGGESKRYLIVTPCQNCNSGPQQIIKCLGRHSMAKKSDFTIQSCRSLVIRSTPSPSKFKTGDDYTVVTLGDLDLIGPKFVGLYVTGIKSGIDPYHIDNSDILTKRTTTISDAALSIYENAFLEGEQ